MTIPAGYAQANFKFIGTGAPNGAEFTLGFDLDVYGGSPTDLATVLYNAWEGNPLTTQSASVIFSSVAVKYGPDATGPSGEYGEGDPGGDSGPQAAPQLCFLVHKVTAAGGRAGRGRMYLPGVAEGGVVETGLLGSAKLAALQGLMDSFYTAITAGDFGPVVLHGEGSPISTPTPITSFVVDPRVGTQRRRNRR